MEVIQQGRAMLCCALKKNLFTSYCEEWTVKGKREAGRQGASRSGRRGWIGTILQWKAQQALVMGCLLGVGSGQRRGGRTRMIPGPLFPPLVCPFLLYYHLRKNEHGLVGYLLWLVSARIQQSRILCSVFWSLQLMIWSIDPLWINNIPQLS